jgi:4-hydroxy-tetrahydrodipicolinate reductase
VSRKLGIVGASGRLGRRIHGTAQDRGWTVTLAADSRGWTVSSTPDVIIDASHQSALPLVASYCRGESVPLVLGTSGLSPADHDLLTCLSDEVAVVWAPNFAQGHLVQLLMLDAALAAAEPWEATVVERHPRMKLDRPSATALVLAAACGAGAEVASIRGGNPVSDHTVVLTAAGETVTVTHRVTDVAPAVDGALRAAAWAAAQPPGLWSMRDLATTTLPEKGVSP